MSVIAGVRASLWLGASVAALVAGAAQAQAVGVGGDRRELDEIVVTAQRREQTIIDVPISMSVVTAQAVQDRNITSVLQLSQLEPSLRIREGFNLSGNTFSIRGNTTLVRSSGVQPSVSVVIDGVPLLRGGEFSTDLGDLQRIEVLKGPQGTLFGTNAVGGVISVVRKSPVDHTEGYVEGTITDDEEYVARGMLNLPLGGRARARVNAFYRDLEPYLHNLHPGGADGGGSEQWGAVGRVDFDLADNFKVSIAGDYRDMDTTMYPVVPLVSDSAGRTAALGPNFPFGNLFTFNQDRHALTTQQNGGLALTLNWDIAASWSLTSISAYRSLHNEVSTDIDSTPANPLNRFPIFLDGGRSSLSPNPLDKLDTFVSNTTYSSEEARLRFQNDSVDWVSGFYYRNARDTLKGENPILVPVGAAFLLNETTSDGTFDLESFGLFTDLTWKLNEKVTLFGGFRGTRETGRNRNTALSMTIPAAAPYVTFAPSTPENATFTTINVAAVNAAIAAGTPGVSSRVTLIDRKDTNDEWSGRIGGSWFVTDKMHIYASASRSFIGLAFDSSAAADPLKPFVDPTTSVAYELGAKLSAFDNRLRIDSALFLQNTKGVQVSTLIPGTVQARPQNAGDLRSRGVEISAQWQASDDLVLSGNAAYVDAEVRNLIFTCYPGQTVAQGCSIDRVAPIGVPDAQDLAGHQGPSTPKFAYTVSAEYNLPFFRSASFRSHLLTSWTWQDDVGFAVNQDPLLVQKAYGTLDMALNFADEKNRWEFSLFAKNLLDEQFVSELNANVGVQGRVTAIVARGAQRYFGARLKFGFGG